MKHAFAVFAVALLLAAPARADITWAVEGPYTGSVAAWGLSQQAGIKQAVEDINAKGGVNGQKVVLKIYDDACDPKQAVSVANRIISEGIHTVLQGSCSASSLAAEPTYIDEAVLVMNTLPTNPKITDNGGPRIFRAVYRDDVAGVVAAEEIIKNDAHKKLVILHDRSAYGQGVAEYVRDRLHKSGVKEILFEAYDPNNHDYSVLVTRLKSMGTEVVFFGGYPVEIGLITRQLRESGSKAQIIAGDLAEPDFWKIAGETGEGALFTSPQDPRKLPGSKEVWERLQKSGTVVDNYALYAYAAAQVLGQAMAQAGGDDSKKAAEAIHKGKFDTILGNFAFDAKGDVQNIHQVMFRWHDGNYMEAGQ